MKWHVTAADARTGEDRTFLVEAASADDAENTAHEAGYLVSQVIAAPHSPAPPPAAHRADPLAELAAAATGPAAPAYVPPAKARAPEHVVAAPEYWGLRFGSIAFLVFAGVFYLAGLLGILIGLGTLVTSLGSVSALGALTALAGFLTSLWPLAMGSIFHALSSACLALRDIARNSFLR